MIDRSTARFGGQTITVIKKKRSGQRGYLGVPEVVSVTFDVTGCLLMPVRSDELGPNHVESGLFKATMPAVEPVLGVQASDVLVFDGVEYLVEGRPQPKPQFDGRVHHVTVFCKHQEG